MVSNDLQITDLPNDLFGNLYYLFHLICLLKKVIYDGVD
jgi:hypothetical protein